MESGRGTVQTPDDLADRPTGPSTKPERLVQVIGHISCFHALSSSASAAAHHSSRPQPQGQGGPQAATEGSFLPHSDGTARHREAGHGPPIPRKSSRDFSQCAIIKDRNPLCVPEKIQRSSTPLLQLFRVIHATSVSLGSNAVKLQV